MALDIDGIRNEFVRVASNFVGDELSTSSRAGQQVPSVTFDRDPENTLTIHSIRYPHHR